MCIKRRRRKPDAFRRAIARALIEARQRTGLSQERLALEAGVNRTFVSGIERGLHEPTLRTIWRLAPKLHTQPRKLIALIEAYHPPTDG